MDMESDSKGGMNCPHCGKKVLLTVGPDAEEKAAPDASQSDSGSWADDLRKEMSPRNSGDENAS